MRSLFFKIFVWFWLAMGLLGTAVVLVITATRSELPEGRGRLRVREALAFQAQTAASLYERDGSEALAEYLRHLERRGPGETFLFDETGHELLARPTPPGAGELVERAARSGELELERTGRETFTALGVITAHGNRYVLVHALRPPPRPRMGPLRWFLSAEPGIQLLRIAVIFLTAGLVCYGLARYLTSPVAKLRRATQQLAAGDLRARVGAAGSMRRDEIADLGRDFDVMAERLESLIQAQQRLLRDISHELRSPLARLNIALGLARQRTEPEAGPALDRIEQEAERLNHLIGELLTLSRLESGVEGADQAEVPLSELVREIVADADFEARSRNCTVRLVQVEECKVRGNPELLRSAVENVVRNAVRHTAEGSEVEVSLERRPREKGSTAIISVRDHGAGVPEEALAELFKPFYRVGDARDRQTGGAGLGLAITERAVRLHQGAVTAANAPTGGLVIELRLPLGSQGTASERRSTG